MPVMPPAPADMVATVTRLWFGDPVGPARAAWFAKDPDFDAQVRDTLGPLVEPAAGGYWDDAAATVEGAVALCVLLDQVPRNAWRDTPRAFAYDAAALALARRIVDSGLDRTMLPVQKLFAYLPFEHAENPADQARAVALFTATDNAQWIDYARRHQAIIDRFGRFPHRNHILGRPSTAEEEAFLATPGSGF